MAARHEHPPGSTSENPAALPSLTLIQRSVETCPLLRGASRGHGGHYIQGPCSCSIWPHLFLSVFLVEMWVQLGPVAVLNY